MPCPVILPDVPRKVRKLTKAEIAGRKKGGATRARRLSAAKRSEIAADGGHARRDAMSAEERAQSARKAALARWGKKAS